MRKEIGVLLVEQENGDLAVQLFAEIKGVDEAFKNLNGKPGDKPSRATLLSLFYFGDEARGLDINVNGDVKMLPVLEPLDKKPDGYVLGEGPVMFPKEEVSNGDNVGKESSIP